MIRFRSARRRWRRKRSLSLSFRAASVGLFLLATAMWLRSYSLRDCVEYYQHSDVAGDADWMIGVQIVNGSFGPAYLSLVPSPGQSRESGFHHFNRGGVPSGWPGTKRLLGFSYWNFSSQSPRPLRAVGIGIPFWAVMPLALGPWGTWWWRRRRLHERRRRIASGVCLTCGYDVRGSGRLCPECGTHVKSFVRG